MEERTPDKIAVFDTLFTTKQIQMYKILFSYLPYSFQKTFAMYIKLSELIYTMEYFQTNQARSMPIALSRTTEASFGTSQPDFSTICDEITPFLPPAEQAKAKQMKGMMESMKNMREMMEMLEMIKGMFPEGMGDFGNIKDLGDMSDIFNGGFDLSQFTGIMEMLQAMTASSDSTPS